MKKLATHTLGCRLNQFETEKVASALAPFDFERAEFEDQADIYLINTCTVTHKADATCRQVISNVARRKGAAKLVVIGCYVDSDRQAVSRLPGVDLVLGNREKPQIAAILRKKWPEMFESQKYSLNTDVTTSGVMDFHGHSRAWLKISDGCNQKCSFCIIPSVRGPLRNNSAPNVIRDVQRLVDGGYHEVVLTGVHIGHFKDTVNNVRSLTDLLDLILAETGLARIRISSLEPQMVDERMIDYFAAHTGRLCRHLHLPLQSGSDRILHEMRRPYRREHYLRAIRALKEAVPGIVIGGDVIVGFPGETDGDFERTVEITDSGLMDYLHVFTYSDRSGTRASEMADKCDARVVAERHRRLRKISKHRMCEALRREVGQTIRAISENVDSLTGRYLGVTDNYLKVLLPGGIGGDKSIHEALASSTAEGYLVCAAETTARVA